MEILNRINELANKEKVQTLSVEGKTRTTSTQTRLFKND